MIPSVALPAHSFRDNLKLSAVNPRYQDSESAMYTLLSQTHRYSLLLAPALLLGACAPAGESDGGAEFPDSKATLEPTVVEVTAIYDAASNQHLFLTSADTVRAGWTTFRFTNASPVLHFVFLDHLPGGRTSKELLSEVSPIFQEATDLIRAGRPEEAGAQFANLPEWFNELVFRGGPGVTSPGAGELSGSVPRWHVGTTSEDL